MSGLLCVDDESRVLDALRRLLHRETRTWPVRYASSGREALALLAAEPADVVLTDMRMPEMDGAALLLHVSHQDPGVFRVVLSGQTDTAAAARAVPVAHQFLTKPCDRAVITRLMERASALRALLPDPALRALVGGVTQLPPVGREYAALHATAAGPGATAGALARCFARDPALLAKLLQLVNSGFFAPAAPVTRVHEATLRLGPDLLHTLVCVNRVFVPGTVGEGEAEVCEVCRGGVAVGRVARALAGGGEAGEDAYTAALLRDVGTLIIADRLPERHQAHLAEARASGRPLFRCEEADLGVGHGEIGAFLLGLWGLPAVIVDVAAHHHMPLRAPAASRRLAATVHVAALLHLEATGGAPAAPEPEVLAELGPGFELEPWRARARALLEAA